ncbi:hypothetical protein AB6849_23090 [Serratia proteamaculans]|uniref:hypothetical protein n=1 Tax=Serratia proteamaculans TaxID=28151 RepID=UPI001C569DCA|nr:hypothetical protein [Serratia proteamaculans]WEO90659.1 hypothetical protein JET59_005440 [Serratia proteamaculans]
MMNTYAIPDALRRGLLMLVAGLLLTGCASEPGARLRAPEGITTAAVPMKVTTIIPDSAPSAGKDNKITQCNNELTALKAVNAAHYARYRSEMDHLVATGRRYMDVKAGISNDINDIMAPRYQYGMASLCWRIRNALSQSLMAQADIPQGRGQ